MAYKETCSYEDVTSQLYENAGGFERKLKLLELERDNRFCLSGLW